MAAAQNIGLQQEPLQQKINLLRSIEEEIESKDPVSALMFGETNTAQSKGDSAVAMEELNARYALVAEKMAKLIKATICYVEAAALKLEETDKELSHGFTDGDERVKGGI